MSEKTTIIEKDEESEYILEVIEKLQSQGINTNVDFEMAEKERQMIEKIYDENNAKEENTEMSSTNNNFLSEEEKYLAKDYMLNKEIYEKLI